MRHEAGSSLNAPNRAEDFGGPESRRAIRTLRSHGGRYPPSAPARVFQVRPSGLTANSKRVLSVAASRKWIRSCCGIVAVASVRRSVFRLCHTSIVSVPACVSGSRWFLPALDGDGEQVVPITESCDAGASAARDRRGVNDCGRDIAAAARRAGRDDGRDRSAVEAQPSSRASVDGRRGRLIPGPLPSWIERRRREVILDRIVRSTLSRCRWQRCRRGRTAATVDRRPALARPT